MESLTPWMDLHVPMNYGGTAHTVMLIGTMPLATLEEIYQMLAQDAPEVDGVDASVIRVPRFFFARIASTTTSG